MALTMLLNKLYIKYIITLFSYSSRTTTRHRSDRIFAVAHRTLSCSRNASANASKKVSKLFNMDSRFSNKGANHDRAYPISKVLTSPTRDSSVG